MEAHLLGPVIFLLPFPTELLAQVSHQPEEAAAYSDRPRHIDLPRMIIWLQTSPLTQFIGSRRCTSRQGAVQLWKVAPPVGSNRPRVRYNQYLKIRRVNLQKYSQWKLLQGFTWILAYHCIGILTGPSLKRHTRHGTVHTFTKNNLTFITPSSIGRNTGKSSSGFVITD